MIDTKELRRLAQAATPGGWYVEGNYIYGCKDVTDGEEEWHPVIACADDDEPVNYEGNAALIAAANPATISELLDRLEEAERERDALRNEIACVKEVEFPRKVQAVADAWKGKCERLEAQCDAAETEALEQARLNGMGAERELALMSKLEAAENEVQRMKQTIEAQQIAYREMVKDYQFAANKIEEMKKQEPVVCMGRGPRDGRIEFSADKPSPSVMRDFNMIPLYALPGAWPSPSIPEGYKLVPIELTHEMVEACYKNWQFGDKSARDIWRDMLAAAPEAK